jgi:anti-anti-sigma factor
MAQASFDTERELTISTIDDSEGSVRVVVEGRLDLATVPRLIAALRSIELRTPGALVVDLALLTYLDASSLRIVLAARRRAVAAGRTLRVEAVLGVVAPVLAAAGHVGVLGLDPRDAAAHV